MRLELTILGTASQAPSRERGQGGYALRWGEELVLFDPGEGCQRQLLLAGLSPAKVTRICVTHFHGDHCLGLPGLLQSRALATDRPITLHYGLENERHLQHLLSGFEIDFDLRLIRQPLEPGDTIWTSQFSIFALALDHDVPTIGFRLEGYPGRHLLPERLAVRGIEGPDIAQVERAGFVIVSGQMTKRCEVSELRDGPVVAFVMDTAPCDAARQLADHADLLICEATFLSAEADLAREHQHLTAAQAGQLAVDGDVGLLVVSHFSNRYPDRKAFEDEARSTGANAVAARDLSTVTWQTRPKPPTPAEMAVPS